MTTANRFPTMWEVLGNCIPEDHCRQVGNSYFIDKYLKPGDRFLDHGCGAGKLKTLLEKTHPEVRYCGVDLALSPEVAMRQGDADALSCFHETDGITLPYADDAFDMVYSSTVFEHIRHPEAALDEIHRVLRPGGGFAASVAYLYPYHSYSIFNYTPYGWFTLLTEHGFDVRELRPGMDGISCIVRGYHFCAAKFDEWFNSSPFHRVIERHALRKGSTIKETNMRKVMNSGVLFSYAVKI